MWLFLLFLLVPSKIVLSTDSENSNSKHNKSSEQLHQQHYQVPSASSSSVGSTTATNNVKNLFDLQKPESSNSVDLTTTKTTEHERWRSLPPTLTPQRLLTLTTTTLDYKNRINNMNKTNNTNNKNYNNIVNKYKEDHTDDAEDVDGNQNDVENASRKKSNQKIKINKKGGNRFRRNIITTGSISTDLLNPVPLSSSSSSTSSSTTSTVSSSLVRKNFLQNHDGGDVDESAKPIRINKNFWKHFWDNLQTENKISVSKSRINRPTSDTVLQVMPRDRRQEMMGPLSEEFSGLQILKSVNLSGRRERPLYVDEPPYILVRREIDYPEVYEPNVQNELFIPPRGRRGDDESKIENIILGGSDPFVPNRGRKRSNSFLPIVLPLEAPPQSPNSLKRALYNELFSPDELFYPNRGKKGNAKKNKNSLNQILNNDLFYPNRGKKNTGLKTIFNDGDLFYPNRGKKWTKSKKGSILNDIEGSDLFIPNRGKRDATETKISQSGRGEGKRTLKFNKKEMKTDKQIGPRDKVKSLKLNEGRHKRDLLDSLSKEKDTFHSSRGRRGFPQIKFGNYANQNEMIKQLKGDRNGRQTAADLYENDGDRRKNYLAKHGDPIDVVSTNNNNNPNKNNEHYGFFDESNINDFDDYAAITDDGSDVDAYMDVMNLGLGNMKRNFLKPTVFFDPVFNPHDNDYTNSNDELILFDY